MNDDKRKDIPLEGENAPGTVSGTPAPEALPARKSSASRLLFVAFIVFCLGAVALTAIDEFSNPSGEKIPLSALNFNYLFAALAAFAGLVAAESVKYYFMIKSATGERHPGIAYNVAVLGKYYDNITPLGAGGQPFQIFYLRRHDIPTGYASAIPVAGFFGLQISFVLIALVCFILNFRVTDLVALRIAAYFGLLMYLLLPGVMLLFTFWPGPVGGAIMKLLRIGAKLHIIKDYDRTAEKVNASLSEYRESVLLMLKEKTLPWIVLGCSLLYEALLMSIPFFVLKAFGGSASFFDTFTMSLYVYAAITCVPTPGNAGAAEGAFYTLFSSLQPAYLFWGMLVWRFFSYYAMLILGVASIFAGYVRKKFSEKCAGKVRDDST